MNLNTPLKDITFVAFDTETSGAFPLSSEVCEIAAVKWKNGVIIGEFQSLIKTKRPIPDNIIAIHGITNEMLVDAPDMNEVIVQFKNFVDNSVVVAHHAPFDLGFLAVELERRSLMFPTAPGLCTSLLSRKLFPESVNHKLQTLIEFFNIEKRTAHRALDDSRGCLDVFLKCAEKFGWDKPLEALIKEQGVKLDWKSFSLFELQRDSVGHAIVTAIEQGKDIELSYRSTKDHRIVRPQGVVRNPSGDWLQAFEIDDLTQSKRFFINRIAAAKLVY